MNCFILYDLTNHPTTTAHRNRQLNFLVRQLTGTFTSRKRTGRKRTLPKGTGFPKRFQILQKVSGRGNVCALFIDKKKKAPSGRGKQTTYKCKQCDIPLCRVEFVWITTSSEMWRCKPRRVGYYMHKFITNKIKKNYHSVFFSFIVMISFLEGRPVYGAIRKLKCPLKNAIFLPMQ